MFAYIAAAVLPCVTVALHPRPEWNETASFARWIVHESDYGVVSTHHDGASGVFGNIISISDGNGYEDSTGVIYTYIPSLDATYQDLKKNDRVAVTFSEMALGDHTSGGCDNSTAESPLCGRFVISGRLTPVPEANKSTALKYLFARHPIMKEWSEAHIFEPFWIEPESITDLFVIDMFGGRQPVTTADYLAAPWYRPAIPSDTYACQVCGHVYDAAKDGNGSAFEDLPESWTCPVCGQRKSSYHKTSISGREVWVHV
jgi:rubredoxin|eukprot:TRINITY_DN3129_c0_g2_i1.p1 TRINITY_DN3129_c0_g2~~TRINITY_DN3129_c0_g2_i1.p1  ORF type:complete len:277 (-),score=24.50 TRINITY_DN3129_c0_g2_i1:126-899(-)